MMASKRDEKRRRAEGVTWMPGIVWRIGEPPRLSTRAFSSDVRRYVRYGGPSSLWGNCQDVPSDEMLRVREAEP